MSLREYQRQLARSIADPSYRRTIASEPGILMPLTLDARERKRLVSFARDPGMRVNTALYRANRLTPIYSALPQSCAALGAALHGVLHAFWSSRELEDLQFASEAARFAAFLRRTPEVRARRGIGSLIAVELACYELLVAPRSSLRLACRPPGRRAMLHPLVRAVSVDINPDALVAVMAGTRALRDAEPGRGGVLVDHRGEPGCLSPLTPTELARCRSIARNRTWLERQQLLVAIQHARWPRARSPR